MSRLSAAAPLSYDPEAHGTGIVHLGLGAFHKAHQAAITDAALAAKGGDWRITGVSLRSRDAADALNAQDGRFTLIERGAEGTSARIIGAIAGALTGADGTDAILHAMVEPACRIVTLTVTEKAYGLGSEGCDPAHPAVAADLADPARPRGVLGLLAETLRQRHAAGTAPFTVLCCDNLPHNGALLRAAVVDFARRTDPALANHIAENVAFPSSMVDRITPAATDATRAEALRLTGHDDLQAVETEPFLQWVIEDDFPQGRPAWEEGGALFVDDVTPYEEMKLRMLNGAHSMLAYAGFHAGHRFVRDVMGDAALAALVSRHLAAAAATLKPLPAIDLPAYADALRQRFENPAIAHETFQIAMDGTQKMPQRIFAPTLDAIAAGQDIRPFAFATAAWLRHVTQATHDTAAYPLRDPRAEELTAAIQSAPSVVEAVCALPNLVPPALAAREDWRASVAGILSAMLALPMAEVIATELRGG